MTLKKYIQASFILFLLVFLFGPNRIFAYDRIAPPQKTRFATPPVTGNPLSVPYYFIQNNGQMDRRVKFYKTGPGHTTSFTEKGVYITLMANADPNRTTQTIRFFPIGAENELKPRAQEKQKGEVNYYLGNDPKKWRTGVPIYGNVVYKEVYPGIDMKFYGRDRELEYDVMIAPGADPSAVRLGYEGIEALKITPTGDMEVVLKQGGSLLQKRPYLYQEIDGKRQTIHGAFRVYNSKLKTQNSKRMYGFQVASYNKQYPLIIDPVVSYSTYLGGSLADKGLGIAVNNAGHVYVTGSTLSMDFPFAPSGSRGAGTEIFVTRIDTTSTSSLVYSTYIGGDGADMGHDIAIDNSGNAYITGETLSTKFPELLPLTLTSKKDNNAFVTKLDATGQISYSTYLGGEGKDVGYGIAVDAHGAAYVTGFTFSEYFPTASPYQGALAGPGTSDAFITKIAPEGATLVYSTYLGGGDAASSTLIGFDEGRGIAVDNSGNAYITGRTSSDNFPVTQSAFNGQRAGSSTGSESYDAFLAKIDTKGTGTSSLLYATYLGGAKGDEGLDIAVDSAGIAYITGGTISSNFPTVTPMQSEIGGPNPNDALADAFMAKMDTKATGTSSLLYSTYLGGDDLEEGRGIAVDSNGFIYVVGETRSNDLKTVSPIQKHSAGGSDLFVARMDLTGNSFNYSTYFGGSSSDTGEAIAVDSTGTAYVTGSTLSLDLRTVSPLQAAHAGPLKEKPEGDFFRESKFDDVILMKIALGEAGPDTTPPLVQEIFPANGAMSQAFVAGVRATFSEPINPNIVNSDAFKVTDSEGRSATGILTYDVGTNQVIFTPTPSLLVNKTYTVEISTAVEDLVGNPLAPFTSNFSTSDPPPPSPGKKKRCFIATAAYGSYLDPHVMILREFRDRYLLTNRPGQVFVDFYYEYSPPVADYIQTHESVRVIARWILTPVVYGVAYPGIAVAILGIFMTGLVFLYVKRRRSG